MDIQYWTERFSQGAARIQASTIRELLKLTQRPGILSFAGGLPDPGLFPKEEAAQKALEILRDLGEKALQYGPTEGYLPLRAWVAERIGVDVEEVLITTGSQQGLDLLSKILLDEGSPVLVEAPSYMGALQAFRAYGPRFVTVPTDEEGMDLEALEETLKRVRPRFIYALPTFQNPSSALMPLGKRERLVELAHDHGVPLVEDDAYAELYFDGKKLPTLLQLSRSRGYGHVLYLGSFSKILAPGLRVAYAVGLKPVIAKLVQAKQGVDLHTPVFNQMLVHALVQEGLEARIARIREVYRTKARAMVEALEKEMPSGVRFSRPKGGMFVWMELPGIPADALLKEALKRDVAFVPGSPFFATGGGENTLRLSYATMSEEAIQGGMRRLGEAVRAMMALA